MKILIAGLATETNSFSPIPTGRLAFEESFVSREGTSETPNLFSAPLHEWRRPPDGIQHWANFLLWPRAAATNSIGNQLFELHPPSFAIPMSIAVFSKSTIHSPPSLEQVVL